MKSMLRAHGVYPTSQRLAIADCLFAEHQHITAEQLHEALQQAGFRVSKATVYNTLGLFVEKGMLREIFIDSSRTFYDSNTGHHHHFYNMDTGCLGDITKDLVPEFKNKHLPEGVSMESVDIVVRVRNRAP